MWSGLGAALVGGGLSVGGSLLGSILNAGFAEDAADTAWVRQQIAAAQAYARQKELLSLQQDYYTSMSNTEHQRQVADLRLAGLNPILSANLGGASSSAIQTPVVSIGTAPQASGVDFGDLGFGKAGELIGKSSAMSLAKKQADQVSQNAASQRALNDANASSAKARAELDKSQVELNEELKQTEQAKQEELRTRSRDNEYTHLYKMPGRVSHHLEKWLESKFPNNSAVKGVLDSKKDGFSVTPVGEVDPYSGKLYKGWRR